MDKIESPHYLKKPVDLSNRNGWKGNKLVYFINSEAIDFKYWAIYYSIYETNNDVINCYRYFTIKILQSFAELLE